MALFEKNCVINEVDMDQDEYAIIFSTYSADRSNLIYHKYKRGEICFNEVTGGSRLIEHIHVGRLPMIEHFHICLNYLQEIYSSLLYNADSMKLRSGSSQSNSPRISSSSSDGATGPEIYFFSHT